MLFDTIINFGESLPETALALAWENAQMADLCLVLGSSCTVTPAADIPELVGRNKSAKLAICNLQQTPLDDVSDLRVFSTADDLMVRVMEKLGISIPRFVLRRRVVLSIGTRADGSCGIVVQGVDAEGVPMTYLRSVRLEGSRRGSTSEPHAISLRDGLAVGCIVRLELEFMGHYREPNLQIHYEVRGLKEEQACYVLEFDPCGGEWMTRRES